MLIPIIPQSDKEPITELLQQRAFIHRDAVYLFNPFTLCRSEYTLFENGFMYAVLKYPKDDLIKQANFIWLSSGAREISGEDFTAFVNQIAALQEQSHLIKPLSPFEDFVNSIIASYGIQIKK